LGLDPVALGLNPKKGSLWVRAYQDPSHLPQTSIFNHSTSSMAAFSLSSFSRNSPVLSTNVIGGSFLIVHLVLRVSALYYLSGDWVSEGFRTVASAHVLCQPTSCGSEYFYNQCPQVRNLIRTERNLNRSEHRVKNEAS